MRRFLGALLVVAPLTILAAGCSDNSATIPSVVGPVETTEKLEGALTPGGVMYHVVTARIGQVTLAMKGIGPDPALKLGMSIGVYSTLSCTALIDNAASTLGTQLTGVATTTTSLCVSVYDPGTLPADSTITYELAITYNK
jgi:hypothetical protein